jgi:hypothetical protein
MEPRRLVVWIAAGILEVVSLYWTGKPFRHASLVIGSIQKDDPEADRAAQCSES